MRASAAGFTLLGLGLLAATGCSSGAGGGFASSRPSWHWPWSKAHAAPESAVAQGGAANQNPALPSQLAQNPQAGGYPPNYYSAPPTDAYAQNPNGAGYTAPTGYGAPQSYGAPNASTGLYDSQSQPAAMAQAGGYPQNQPPGNPQQAPVAGYPDPAVAVNNEYYNQAYARPEANGYAAGAAAPAGGYAAQPGYAPADAGQAPMGYDAQAAAAMPANPAMPQISHPEAQVADSRYGTGAAMGGPAAQPQQPQPMYDPGYVQQGGDRYAPPGSVAPGAYQDPTSASTTAGQYNEPSGFQPGATGYAPGANGFQPAGTAPYQSPTGAYNANPNGSRYRPGSTGDYYTPPAATGSPAGPVRTSSISSPVAPANYTAAPGATGAEVPAIYAPSTSDAPAGLPQ